MVGATAGNEKIYDAMWGTRIVHTAYTPRYIYFFENYSTQTTTKKAL